MVILQDTKGEENNLLETTLTYPSIFLQVGYLIYEQIPTVQLLKFEQFYFIFAHSDSDSDTEAVNRSAHEAIRSFDELFGDVTKTDDVIKDDGAEKKTDKEDQNRTQNTFNPQLLSLHSQFNLDKLGSRNYLFMLKH